MSDADYRFYNNFTCKLLERNEQMETAKAVATPIGDKILVQPIEPDDRTPGGILIPDNASSDAPTRGVVLAVGAGKMLRDGSRADMLIDEGDVVVFNGYRAAEVEMDGEKLMVVSEPDVLLVEG